MSLWASANLWVLSGRLGSASESTGSSLLEGDSNYRYTYLLDDLATFNARFQPIEIEVFGAVWTVGKGKVFHTKNHGITLGL